MFPRPRPCPEVPNAKALSRGMSVSKAKALSRVPNAKALSRGMSGTYNLYGSILGNEQEQCL